MATHPRYDAEFRLRIVELVRKGDQSVLSIAKEFGCSIPSIYKWLPQSDLDDAASGALEVLSYGDHHPDPRRLARLNRTADPHLGTTIKIARRCKGLFRVVA